MSESEFPRRPQLLKGALAVYPSHTPGPPPKLIVFQYNPETVRRTLASRTPQQERGTAAKAREEILRVSGPPLETITVAVLIDAVDQYHEALNGGPPLEDGLHPALATLELLLYPPADWLRGAERDAGRGQASIAPGDLPLVLLVWGKSRVVPVSLTSFSVTEEEFDTALNPIRARVELGFRVLTSLELPKASAGHNAFRAYHADKERLAQRYTPDPGQTDQSTFATSATTEGGG